MNEKPNFSAQVREHATTLEGFTKSYEGNPPWETGRPQPPFVEHAERVIGPLLDCGCGTGNTALFFAERGLQVTGIDFVEAAIRRAKAKAEARGLRVEFLVKDAMQLGEWGRRFASVIDSGLFHIYPPAVRKQYIAGVREVLEPGGRLFLFSFSEREKAVEGGATREEISEVFAEGWALERCELTSGEVNEEFQKEFSDRYGEGGATMWFVIARKVG